MAGQSVLPGNLTGSFHVRAVRPAFGDAHHFLKGRRDRAILQRHSLKLRFWPEKQPADESGKVLDLDWSWIKAFKTQGVRIGELRVNERVGDCDNLRIIFFDPEIREPHPTLWILAALQKKSDHFTKANIATFKARRQIVLERFYEV